MKKQKLTIWITVGLTVVLALLCLLIWPKQMPSEQASFPASTEHQTEPVQSQPESSVEPESSAEPEAERFVLTFVGDCTLGTMPNWAGLRSSFNKTIGTNYDFPFDKVRDIFDSDDFTLINLESVMTRKGKRQNKLFTFKGPEEYVNILTGSSVEAVTLANNHSMDFGKQGYNTTIRVLNDNGIAYAEEDETFIYTTQSGLVVGVYGDYAEYSTEEIQENIRNLQKAGAEVIICAFHWGKEGSYRANDDQKRYAEDALNAGAHIVYGHHPHVLQQMEMTDKGLIMYSLGNFSFGGNPNPRDKDSAIIQQEIIRQPDGSITLGTTTTIPVRITSAKGRNNYQPIPYEPGTAQYDRVISKLDGTYTGKNLSVSYAKAERRGAKAKVPAPAWDSDS